MEIISDQQTSVQGPSDPLVRINMGQMLRLKDLGYEVMGLVNGPNEGYPKYEVLKTVLEALTSGRTRDANADVTTGPDIANSVSMCIDPVLLCEDEQLVAEDSNVQPEFNTNVNTADLDQPTTPLNAAAEPGPIHKTPKKQLGKRPQVNLSPQTVRVPRNHKKKKLTDDDRAAMEAQEMIESESKRIRKPARRK